MLSEGYLSGISYWFDDGINDGFSDGEAVVEMPRELGSICNFTYSSLEDTQSKGLFHKCKSAGKLISTIQVRENINNRYQKSTLQQSTQNVVCERQTSHVVDITGDSNINRETYLVPSSCKSMFRNYNDLYIAGDQVMPLHSGITDFTCDSSFEFCDGPFLESSEIPPTMESMLAVSNDLVHQSVRKDSFCWQVGSIKDKSIIQHPLSNSSLNEYLEQKVIELYNQYIMDSMVNNASPTQLMTSEFIMNNVDQISMWISREQNMATTKAKDMVINCLRRLASGKMSTEISTPHLQISSESHKTL
ncbi:TLR adapter interacting with SLC15A4 on the lysosome isoform X2 [Microcaecilia unicolor]|nr:uncharacterized protein CXorf21 homolog isoform X2 [Microcaecilia unicolor]XP_030058235.1 uncharacterized protein CXorf21 homolog isoform X2 [Microcaecilia unicolor]XP_030058236.1 uncharacterized protein CXorf21 homolog isoform X2 [Microcaecilia unicolor]